MASPPLGRSTRHCIADSALNSREYEVGSAIQCRIDGCEGREGWGGVEQGIAAALSELSFDTRGCSGSANEDRRATSRRPAQKELA